MKRYAKIVQSDARGQIIIPKDVRTELRIAEGTGFYIYIIEDEGIFLKTIPKKKLSDHAKSLEELQKNASKIKIKKENLDRSVKKYDDESTRNLKEV